MSQDNPQLPLAWPPELSVEWVRHLMRTFDWSSRNLPPSQFSSVLPVQVLDSLLQTASKIFQKEPNCVRIEPHHDSVVVVVGDIHGQLHDLMFVLQDAGFPDENRRIFVFNGDYVDRGAWGLETFLVLLSWKVLMPRTVYLLRGNHESEYCTSLYGFQKEVLTKYGHDNEGDRVYRTCLDCFQYLPLASIIAGCVYTAHGGLFRSVITQSKEPQDECLSLGSLEELSEARRVVIDPPWEGPNLIPGDVLWSDPSMSPGLHPNRHRGIGLLWGPDCTQDFLQRFHLKLIIRSHEGPDTREKRPGLARMHEGYTIDHIVESGKLITLFSAPDYPQFQATEERYKNKGAYIVLEPPNFDNPNFHHFEAVTPRPKVDAYYDYKDVIYSDEELDVALMASREEHEALFVSSSHMQGESSVSRPAVSVGSSMTKKKGRGPTRGFALAMALRINKDKKLPLIVDNGEPVGVNSKFFMSEMGRLIREHMPIRVKNWACINKEMKDKLIMLLLEKFSCEDTHELRASLEKKANRIYRKWRSDLHTEYKKYETNAKYLEHIPKNLTKEDWDHLIELFSSETFKGISLQNSKNREKRKEVQRTGRKTFQAIRYDHEEGTTLPIESAQKGERTVQLTADDAMQQLKCGPKPARSSKRQRIQVQLMRELEETRRERDEIKRELEEVRRERDTLAQQVAGIRVLQDQMRQQQDQLNN